MGSRHRKRRRKDEAVDRLDRDDGDHALQQQHCAMGVAAELDREPKHARRRSADASMRSALACGLTDMAPFNRTPKASLAIPHIGWISLDAAKRVRPAQRSSNTTKQNRPTGNGETLERKGCVVARARSKESFINNRNDGNQIPLMPQGIGPTPPSQNGAQARPAKKPREQKSFERVLVPGVRPRRTDEPTATPSRELWDANIGSAQFAGIWS